MKEKCSIEEDIDKTIDCLTSSPDGPFEKINCPECNNSALMISIPHAEWVSFPGKDPICKRLRFELKCLHCGLELHSPDELEQRGIKTEIEE